MNEQDLRVLEICDFFFCFVGAEMEAVVSVIPNHVLKLHTTRRSWASARALLEVLKKETSLLVEIPSIIITCLFTRVSRTLLSDTGGFSCSLIYKSLARI